MASERPRRRFTRARFVGVALAGGLVGQAPGLALLALAARPRLGGAAWWGAILVGLVAMAPLAARLRIGDANRAERGLLGAALLAFYAWWGTSLVAGVVAPIVLPVGVALGVPVAVSSLVALAVGAYAGVGGVSWRRHARLHRVELAVDGLPAALDGYRIAQLSDLHVGPHTSPARVRGWVDRVNRLAPDLVAITGDLIASGDDYLDDVARELGRLRGKDGVALCMGNHDYFADHARLVAGLERVGIEVLRNRGRAVERADLRYWLAGVDDTWSRKADVERALDGRPDGAPAIVLAHDPALFDECAARGATVVLSGHTHGGQIALPLFSRTVNFARLVHRYTAGTYRSGGAHLYVSRGAGTTGLPLRIGAPSEIALITLRSARLEGVIK
jgi:predicted MPP superfamily phosphohydrolase